MGTFCFDHYNHPLLWCDEKKRLVERKNADECIRSWNRKKAENLAKLERDKKEYYELAMNHCPWGRPGGGAPNLDIRMRNITAEGLHPTPKYNVRNSGILPCRINVSDIKKQTKSAVDRLYISLKDKPVMSFRHKGHVNIELSYKPQKKRKSKVTLDKITVTKISKNGNEKNLKDPNTTSSETHKTNADPVGSSLMRSLGWTNKEMTYEMDQQGVKNNYSEKSKKKGQCCPLCSCDCNIVNVAQQQKSPKQKRVNSGKKISSSRYENIGKKTRRLCGNQISPCERFIKHNHCISNDVNVERVPLLAQRGMHRPISLCSTDIANRKNGNRWTKGDVQYINDLMHQIAQKRQIKKLDQAIEQDLCNRHFQTIDTFWGRPGHGAPKNCHHNKLNLDDLLHGLLVQ